MSPRVSLHLEGTLGAGRDDISLLLWGGFWAGWVRSARDAQEGAATTPVGAAGSGAAGPFLVWMQLLGKCS